MVERMVELMLQQKITRMHQRRSAPLILELDLTDGLADEPPTDPFSALLTMRRPRLADVLDGLRRARSDDRVRALVVKVPTLLPGARCPPLKTSMAAAVKVAFPPKVPPLFTMTAVAALASASRWSWHAMDCPKGSSSHAAYSRRS